MECPEHGVRQLPVPWADSTATLTALCEVSLIDWPKDRAMDLWHYVDPASGRQAWK